VHALHYAAGFGRHGTRIHSGIKLFSQGGKENARIGSDSLAGPSNQMRGKIIMKIALGLLLSFGVATIAQDMRKENKPPVEERKSSETRRLGSVTWDLTSHKLHWVVETGTTMDGKFVPSSSKNYEISPDQAVMAFDDEKRSFTKEEAASLHRLLDVLSLYCAESVVWWDQGQGSPVDPNARPAAPRPGRRPDTRNEAEPMPRKVGAPQPAAAEDILRLAMLIGAR
jgi:hypothetical protein